MDIISMAEAARRLETDLPRVQRTIARLGLKVERRSGGRARLKARQVERLRRELGVVPRVDGLSRIETQVLAALARSPRGLVSARAVARRAGVSPTAASAAVRSLIGRGLVLEERAWVAAGRAREVTLVRANLGARKWVKIASQVAAVVLPAGDRRRRTRSLPARLRHLFWNADPDRVDLLNHGGYVAERLLSSHDLDGIAWGSQALRARDWAQAARNRGLSPGERALARNLARASR